MIQICELISKADYVSALASVAHLVGALSHRPTGGGFDPHSEHIHFSLTLMFLSLSASLSKAMKKCPRVMIKKNLVNYVKEHQQD